MKIEFFHDVICSFCFPMSARMRRIAKKYNNIEIIHRSFALAWEAKDFIRSFGSREAVKSEVLGHWEHANKNDDEHRFNIEGMRKTNFNFPLSKPALKASKAAGLIGGEDMYWDVFDRLQNKLFVENKNIEDLDVIEEAVKETSISFPDWKAQFENEETEKAVLEDFKLVQFYGVNSVPTLVINQKYSISGAQSQERIEKALARISK
ncbi:MAG: DsbA family protein, partial [Clostridiaceae bacterium]|nr:DsbA family protein [Clostridiaceae bacterium]